MDESRVCSSRSLDSEVVGIFGFLAKDAHNDLVNATRDMITSFISNILSLAAVTVVTNSLSAIHHVVPARFYDA